MVSNPEEQVVGLGCVVGASVEVEAMSGANMVPPRAREHHELQAGDLPVVLTGNSHYYLLDEVRRRSNFEYEPEEYVMLGDDGGGGEASVGSASGSSSSGGSTSEQPSGDDDTNSTCSSVSDGSMQEE